MNTLFKKENLKTTIFTFLYLILGILFCALQVTMYNFVESVLCVILLGAGVISVVIYALMSQEDKIFKLLFFGIISLTLAILMLVWPRFFGIILSIIAGLGGLMTFVDSLKDKKKGIKTWVTDFVIGLIVVLMAIVTIVLSGTNVAKLILSIFFGIIFLTQGIYGLVQLIILVKKEKMLVESLKNKQSEVKEEMKADEIKTDK